MNKLNEIKELADAPLWPGLAEQVPGKGNRLYVSATTIMDMLNTAFKNSWSVEYSQPWVEPFSGNKPVVTVKATIKVRTIDPETKEPITIVREGYGSETMKNGPDGAENVTKIASTDALKRAAYTFGIISEITRQKNPVAVKYFNYINSEWKPEMSFIYQKELGEIANIRKQYGINDVMFNAMVYTATDGRTTKLLPYDTKTVLEFIKNKLANVINTQAKEHNVEQQQVENTKQIQTEQQDSQDEKIGTDQMVESFF